MAPTTLNPKDLGRIAGRIIDREIGNIDFSVKTDGSEYRRRWSTVQAAMRAKGYNVGYACGGGWIVATSPGSPVFDPIVDVTPSWCRSVDARSFWRAVKDITL